MLTFGAVYGILSLSRGEAKQPRSHQERKCGDEVGTLGKNVKNPLTNHPSYDTIRASRGEGNKPHTPRHW